MTNQYHNVDDPRLQDDQPSNQSGQRPRARDSMSPREELREMDACCRAHGIDMGRALHGRLEPAAAVSEPGGRDVLDALQLSDPLEDVRDPIESVTGPLDDGGVERSLDVAGADIEAASKIDLDLSTGGVFDE